MSHSSTLYSKTVDRIRWKNKLFFDAICIIKIAHCIHYSGASTCGGSLRGTAIPLIIIHSIFIHPNRMILCKYLPGAVRQQRLVKITKY